MISAQFLKDLAYFIENFKKIVHLCVKNMSIYRNMSFLRSILHVESISGSFKVIRGRHLTFRNTFTRKVSPKAWCHIGEIADIEQKKSLSDPKQRDTWLKLSQTDLLVSTIYPETYSAIAITIASLRIYLGERSKVNTRLWEYIYMY